MGKYTFIYNTGKLRVFCDMETNRPPESETVKKL